MLVTAMMLVTISICIGEYFKLLGIFFIDFLCIFSEVFFFFVLKHCIRFVVNYSFICSFNRLLLKNNSCNFYTDIIILERKFMMTN